MLLSIVCVADTLELMTTDDGFRVRSSGWIHPAQLVDELTLRIPGTPDVELAITEHGLPSPDVALANPDARKARFRINQEVPEALELDIARTELKLRMKGGHELRVNIGPSFKPAEREVTPAERDMVMRFESLGDNCEFGLLQRRVGRERLSLFRYAGSRSLDLLIEAIETNFDGFATEDDLQIVPFHDMWDACSRRYGLEVHTYIYRDKLDADAARRAESTKLAFMAGLLAEDLQSAHKIFVRRGVEDDEAGIHKLYDTLRRKGPNRLLWVTEASPPRAHGDVERLAEGLYHGFIGRLTPFSGAIRLDIGLWLSLLARAEQVIGDPDYEVGRRALSSQVQ